MAPTAIKILSLVRAAPEIAPSAFRMYCGESYFPELLAIPNIKTLLRRVVQNYVQPVSPREDAGPAGWSGVVELWFANPMGAEAFLSNVAVRQLERRHATKLPQIVDIPVREQLMWDHGAEQTTIKQMAFFRPRAGLSREQAQHYWNGQHVALGTSRGMGRRLAKYIQNHTLASYRTRDARYDYAGGPESWFNTIEDFKAVAADHGLTAALASDEAKFMDRASAVMMVVDEVVVYESQGEVNDGGGRRLERGQTPV